MLLELFSVFFLHFFLIFEPNSPFSKGYSLCIVAIFANFQNGLIFLNINFFFEPFFCMEQLYCAFRAVFSIFF